MKKFFKLLAFVLALSLLTAFVINASNFASPLKKLTQKKVPNPNNLLNASDIVWASYATKNGITYERNEDGSWHIYGTSTVSDGIELTMGGVSLEAGKTYMLSSGMKHDSVKSYVLWLRGSDGNYYMGDLTPDDYNGKPAHSIYGAFEAKAGVTYYVEFYVKYAGAVIDEVVYPCLVEGTEAGEFYIYK